MYEGRRHSGVCLRNVHGETTLYGVQTHQGRPVSKITGSLRAVGMFCFELFALGVQWMSLRF